MNNPTIVPVFFSCDDNYLPFLSVALRSMIDNLGTAPSAAFTFSTTDFARRARRACLPCRPTV